MYSAQLCAFCHTPHFANNTRALRAPLWNRFIDTAKVFVPQRSATLDTSPGNPNMTISALCLGCHDGTIGSAVVRGITGSDKHDLINAPGPGGIPDTTSGPNGRRCHGQMYGDPPAEWQGTDLSNDHPIAMTYPTAAHDPVFNVPPSLTNGLSRAKLYGGRVECLSCHFVHDPADQPFLRLANAGRAVRVTCHEK